MSRYSFTPATVLDQIASRKRRPGNTTRPCSKQSPQAAPQNPKETRTQGCDNVRSSAGAHEGHTSCSRLPWCLRWLRLSRLVRLVWLAGLVWRLRLAWLVRLMRLVWLLRRVEGVVPVALRQIEDGKGQLIVGDVVEGSFVAARSIPVAVVVEVPAAAVAVEIVGLEGARVVDFAAWHDDHLGGTSPFEGGR